MANLDPATLPMIDPPLTGREPVRPLTDRGPEWIDQETVALLGQRIGNGLVSFPPETDQVVAGLDDAVLQATFAQHLSASPLSSGFAIEVRVFALAAAIRELVGHKTSPVSSSGAQLPVNLDALWSLTQLEQHHQAGLAQVGAIMQRGADDPVVVALCDLALTLDPKQLAQLTGIPVGTLAAWRHAGKGPKFLSPSNRQILYPVGPFIEWMYGVLR
jgi:hypothetical protein